MSLFINEQFKASEIRLPYLSAEQAVWSPVSCRHCMWTFKPLVRCDERGNTIKGSRQRNPFPPYRD